MILKKNCCRLHCISHFFLFVSVAELNKKWKNLRDKYRIEVSKVPKKISGDGTDGEVDMLSDEDDANHKSDDESQVF